MAIAQLRDAKIVTMLSFSAKQFEALRQRTIEAAMLEIVADWRAAYEVCFGRRPRFDFDTCWQVAEYVTSTLEDLPEPSAGRAAYALTHAMLTAADRGATPDQLREGMAAYCHALPASEAAMIRFEMICAVVAIPSWPEAVR